MTETPTSISEPLASAESTVRQPLFFPKFKDGGPHLNKLYTKVWKAPFVNGVTDEWRARVVGYWERLEIKYGVIWSRPVIDYDPDTGTIFTAATPLALIPGERYEVQG
jgi:hypothetical protein